MARENWPTMPPGIAALPRQEGTGYPIPWFVETLPNGSRDFRIMSSQALRRAITESRCWTCGRHIVDLRVGDAPQATFVLGPMCAVNRTSGEPPSHWACAEWSAQVCPFLTTPGRSRREANLPEQRTVAGGQMIERNPGVALLWASHSWQLRRADNGVLWDVGKPYRVAWLREGRPATRAEVEASLTAGLPTLQAVAEKHGEMPLLIEAVRQVEPLLPAAT